MHWGMVCVEGWEAGKWYDRRRRSGGSVCIAERLDCRVRTTRTCGLARKPSSTKVPAPSGRTLSLFGQKPASTIRIEVPLRFVPIKDSAAGADHRVMETATTLKEATALEETTSPQRRWSIALMLLLLLVVGVLVFAVLDILTEPITPDCFSDLILTLDVEAGEFVPPPPRPGCEDFDPATLD